MMSSDSSIVRMFATEFSSEYNYLIKNGFVVDEEFVLGKLKVVKEKHPIKKLFDWLLSTFDYLVSLRELAVTKKILFENKHRFSKEQIADFENRIEELEKQLFSK